MQVEIKATDVKPKNISYNNISGFLLNLFQATQLQKIYLYKFVFEYGKQPVFVIGEDPEQRQTCCDLMQYPSSVDIHKQKDKSIPAYTYI
jgi:hypothetical protein